VASIVEPIFQSFSITTSRFVHSQTVDRDYGTIVASDESFRFYRGQLKTEQPEEQTRWGFELNWMRRACGGDILCCGVAPAPAPAPATAPAAALAAAAPAALYRSPAVQWHVREVGCGALCDVCGAGVDQGCHSGGAVRTSGSGAARRGRRGEPVGSKESVG
jgi:hypothetical protein